jgi:S1-C subfamily serine protease
MRVAMVLLCCSCVVTVSGSRPALVEHRSVAVGGRLRLVWRQFTDAPGFLVDDVEPGRAAARAGVLRGDCVMAIDHQPIAPNTNLTGFLNRFRPGQPVELTVVRGASQLTLPAVMDEPRPVEFVSPVVPVVVVGPGAVCTRTVPFH